MPVIPTEVVSASKKYGVFEAEREDGTTRRIPFPIGAEVIMSCGTRVFWSTRHNSISVTLPETDVKAWYESTPSYQKGQKTTLSLSNFALEYSPSFVKKVLSAAALALAE